ncbi:MAG: helix-turn-helix domain-containing protein [Limosilactobacillus sp.]
MTTFERIKELAKKRGYTLSSLNDKAGLGKNSIYHWKTKEPSMQSLDKVAKVLGVSADYLRGKTDKTKTADLADKDTVFTYEGRQIPPEDLEYMKRLLRGGKQ